MMIDFIIVFLGLLKMMGIVAMLVSCFFLLMSFGELIFGENEFYYHFVFEQKL